jgi:hypothetical protein
MITFLGMGSRTSGEIRGRQVAQALGGSARFVDVHNPDWNVIQQNEIVLFVRTWEGNLARELKRRGYIIGYEVADMPVGDAVFRNAEVSDLSAYAHPECDFFVVNNHVQLGDMASVCSKPCYVIPHHSTNVSGKAAPFRTKPERVGYVGLPEQLSGRNELETLCKKYDVQFVSVHPNTREECDEVFRSLDIGVVFAESDSTMRPRVVELMRRYKPNTKLSNFQAYGIPTICIPYESYKEHGGDACIFIETKEEMLQALEKLLINHSLRLVESYKAYTIGKHFHIDEILKIYHKMAFEVISCRG